MDLLSRTRKPAFVFRPGQILRRLRVRRGEITVPLPWGLPLEVDAREAVGNGIARTGVHELPVTEAAWRLSGGDRLAVDVGANTGYFTGLLALRAGAVEALEPHPALYERTARNIAHWGSVGARVSLREAAASERSGASVMYAPADFTSNHGVGSLVPSSGAAPLDIDTTTLDRVIGRRAVGLMKIDVEGHEHAALTGASAALTEGRIRDILFEEREPIPTRVSRLLEGHGYTLFTLVETFRGVRLGDATDRRGAPRWDAPTYLATLDPGRARRLFASSGWNCLRPRGRSPR